MTRVVIFADASANWVIAGLRQIERIIFALEELGAAPAVEIVWDAALPASERRLPERRYAEGLTIREATEPGAACVGLTTHLLLARGDLARLLPKLAPTTDARGAEAELARAGGRLLATESEVPAGEAWLMKSLGKAQDGFVSRYFDRRISTWMSRWLIRHHVQPATATWLGFVVALVGCGFLLRGDSAAILYGMLLIYGFSIFDGCDGEIARAQYLDSPAGKRLDLLVDTMVSVLFFISLGFGLARVATVDWQRILFVCEGLVTALSTILSEGLLALLVNGVATGAASGGPQIYERHVQMLGHSGVMVFGRRAVHLVVQLTKRDVSLFAFVILAAIGWPAWILHLSCAVALLAASLSAVALIRRPAAATA